MKILMIKISMFIILIFTISICYSQIVNRENISPLAMDYRLKGIEYGASGKLEEAKQKFEKALEIDQNFLGAKDCLEITEDALSLRIDKKIAVHIFKGSIYNLKGNFKDAIVELETALSINPNYAHTHATLGMIYVNQRMFNKAIDYFKKALDINPNLVSGHVNLSSTYIVMKMLDKAIAHAETALSINPNIATAHNNIGMVYLIKDMPDKVIPPSKKAIDINPDYAAAHNNLAVAYYLTKQYNLAIKHCDKALELGAPVHPDFLNALKPYRK